MKPSEILKLKREFIRSTISCYPVENPRIFGSVARGEDTEESDLDILVDTLPECSLFHLGGLYEDLAQGLGINISLCTSSGLQAAMLERVLKDAIHL
ncbi:UNVERIFIED_ORG: putative nucleotidyltransferase [Pantoea brenneri]|nr:putative nucleotidyltransferase [Pantoea brenneri]